jgi:hypothetical protein
MTSILPTGSGFGTISVGATSVAVSTVTVGPNSNTWKMPLSGPLRIGNAPGSAGNLIVNPLGGVATATSGISIAPNFSLVFDLGGSTVAPTVISNSTATAQLEW